MKTIKIILTLLYLMTVSFMFVSCASKGNELVGSWSRSFGLNDNPYTEVRAFTSVGANPSFYHTFVFEIGKDGKGHFKDEVTPLDFGLQPDDIAAGSKVTGEWEIKENKLFLYYDGDITLNNSDKIEPGLEKILIDAMKKQFLNIYGAMGEKGLPYEIFEKNDKTGLKIQFGNDTLVFSKVKDNNKDN